MSFPDLTRGDQSSEILLSVSGISVSMTECHTALPTIDENNDQTGVPPALEATFEDDDSLSTVSPFSHGGRNNNDLSFTSDTTDMVAELQSFSRPFSIVFHDEDEDDDLSMSSINTEAMKKIKDLRTKLEIQENTKLELLHQLQNKITHDGSMASMETRSMLYMRALKKANNKLREASSKTELEFMNDMDKMEMSMRGRDERIAELEEEVRVLKFNQGEEQ
jgi:hypothetical protein